MEIAKALGRQTKILVLDEPTSRLSLDDRSRLFRLMRNVASTGTSIVFISHFLEEVLGVADRITVLRDGRVVAQGPTATFDVARVSSLMLGGTGTVKAETEQLPTQQSARDGEVLLAVHGVSCGWQVRKVALEVRAGEIVGLAGVVGSGRSSFARGLVERRGSEREQSSFAGRLCTSRAPGTRGKRDLF